MRVLPYLLAGLFALGAPPTAAEPGPRIIGGRDASQLYPGVVSYGQGFHECGGALVAPRWVLTAKHCSSAGSVGYMRVRLGSNDNTQGESVRATRWVPHPEEVIDLALMQLATPAKAPTVAIAADAPAGTATRLLGWGRTDPDSPAKPKLLQELDTRVLADAVCVKATETAQEPMRFHPGAELCTDNPGGRSGACQGDSGGPQIRQVGGRWELVGVTSRGTSARCGEGPSIYLSVPAHRAWIVQQAG